MDNIWNVLLCKLDGNKVLNPTNNPTESGRYLCTCVRMFGKDEVARYLKVMEYDANNKHWHDIGNPSGLSHNILAWTDKIQPCDFCDYCYLAGGYFTASDLMGKDCYINDGVEVNEA